MWRQIYRQMWNQRRANAWLWVELCIVTVLLWYGIDLVYNYEGLRHVVCVRPDRGGQTIGSHQRCR